MPAFFSPYRQGMTPSYCPGFLALGSKRTMIAPLSGLALRTRPLCCFTARNYCMPKGLRRTDTSPKRVKE